MLSVTKCWTELKSTDDVIRFGIYGYKPVVWENGQTDPNLFAFTRTYNNKTYWIITNFTEYNYQIGSITGNSTVIKASKNADLNNLPSYSTIVLELH